MKNQNSSKHASAFIYNDGGRKAAGWRGNAGDCVVRAISIATGQNYQNVYDKLAELNRAHADSRRGRVARKLRARGASPRDGNFKAVYHPFLLSLGWNWTPTMWLGSGCKVHLRAEELPGGTIIARCSRHLVAVIDGVINDTHDPSRNGTRCVYGYYSR